jgi:polyisoprenoid-binding protein YceI
MKKLIAILFVAVSMTSFGQNFNLNVSDASVYFHYVSEDTKGSLSGVTAKVNIDPSNLGASTVTGTADVTTLTTKNKTRDKHLQSADFFDAAKFPTMKFVSGEITKDGDGYKANGKLTIKETTKDVTFAVSEKDGVLRFKTTIFSEDYGVAVKKAREKSKVIIIVKIPVG